MGVIEASGFARKGVQMTDGKQGAAEWLRGIVDGAYRNETYPTCAGIVRTFFGLECPDVRSCGSCILAMLTAIAGRIDAERALPVGVEWPRFEDGELVKIGDEVEFEGETMRVFSVAFNFNGWVLWCARESFDGRLCGSYGERVKRPTPKVLGADGAPIEVGDVVYFVADKDESALIVECIDVSGEKPVVDLVYSDERGTWHLVDPEKLTHERPDSWERIEEDAKLAPRAYLEKRGMNPEKTERIASMMADLVRRAKALAKAGEQ